jgi:hypothetical protein
VLSVRRGGGPCQARSGQDFVLERFALDVLEDHEHTAAVLDDVVDRGDMGVGDSNRGPRFLQNARAQADVVCAPRDQALQRNLAAQTGIAREKDLSHPALAEAVKAFPQNINVAAVLSLAGIGPEKTVVEIWTSNAYLFNQHEVMIEGKSGTIQTITRNVPSPDNPKTSALAVYSAIATLGRIFSSVRIGT